MKFDSQIVTIINAQTDDNSHPTIPFDKPGGDSGSDSGSDSGTVTGPTIILSKDKSNYKVGESGKVQVAIDTENSSIDEFKIIIEYDSSHIQIKDSDITNSGIQIDFLDTHFQIVESNNEMVGNKIETNVTGTESGLKGRITIHARANSGQAVKISNRVIAEINFLVLSSKNSKLEFAKNSSTLLSDSTNILEKNTLQPLTISSLGGVETSTIPDDGTDVSPITALGDNPGSLIILLTGTFLVALGVFLNKKIRDAKKI